MYEPRDVFYMNKLVVGATAAGQVDIAAPIEDTVRAVSRAKGGEAQDVTVAILARPRHEELIARVRATGARIKLFDDGDVAVSIAAASPGSAVDLLVGIGGTPEGVITACAMKAMGGEIQAQLAPQSDEERQRALRAGHDLDRVLRTDDLVTGDNAFFVATGITDGDLLQGVRYVARGAKTRSLVMRSRSGTVRSVESTHALDKVQKYA
jgi:fructose-1,6-bisphosphatase II